MWKGIQDQNIQDISLKCDICGKNVKNGHNLGDHFYLEHVTYFDSNCGKCAKYCNICTTSGSILTIPTKLIAWTCKWCAFICENKSKLKGHEVWKHRFLLYMHQLEINSFLTSRTLSTNSSSNPSESSSFKATAMSSGHFSENKLTRWMVNCHSNLIFSAEEQQEEYLDPYI